jgi:hypothetical protein
MYERNNFCRKSHSKTVKLHCNKIQRKNPPNFSSGFMRSLSTLPFVRTLEYKPNLTQS